MKRIEIACYALLASAFILAGMLISSLNQRGGILPTADATMVISRGDLTLMTAKTKNSEEALFVLDNYSKRLSIFTVDMAKNRMELAISPIKLEALFKTSEDEDHDDDGRRRRGRR
jgi:hypothetical protein